MVLSLNADERKQREKFFRAVLGAYSGYVAFARIDRKKNFHEEFFFYPDKMEDMLTWIEKHAFGNNLYFCPQLFASAKRNKANVQITACLWADLDTADPAKIIPVPSVVLETSPERYQAFWPLTSAVEPVDAEDTSRRIAYAFKDEGADISGWDLTQLLRIPLTLNMKYEKPLHIPTVQILVLDPDQFTLNDFKAFDPVPGFEYAEAELPEEMPKESAEAILERHRNNLPERVFILHEDVPETADWSTALWNLECLLLESGLTREEAYIVAEASSCNKFKRDKKPGKYLWRDICRAYEHLKIRSGALLPQEIAADKYSLLSEEEMKTVANMAPGFVERYCAWGKSRGDAAPEYHVAGAFTILSGLLCGAVQLPTSYGILYINLWFMLLADTTLTRKTTAIDQAMDLLVDVDPDVVLATDGSIEGLLSALALRTGRPSIFWRDEFTGLIEQMKKRDYYAGMAEMFTKLYDGKYQKRILRKEIIEVRSPRLIIFCGGIFSRMAQLLDYSYVESGFFPRFITITAEADVTQLRALGPMTTRNDTARQDLLKELQNMRKAYEGKMTIITMGIPVEVPKVWDAVLDEATWQRYNELENLLLAKGLESDGADLLTPTYDRLAKNILKASVLLAAADHSLDKEHNIRVQMKHLLRAIHYGNSWREHAARILVHLGRGATEQQLERLMQYIRRFPGVTRSKLMQAYHLTAREAEYLAETLDQRGLIQRSKFGRTERYYPINIRGDV